MKRTVVLLTAAAVAAPPLAASAAPPVTPKRVLTYEYSGFQAGSVSAGAGFSSENGCDVVEACWDFATVKGEKTIEVKAEDATGTPIGIQVFYDDAYADNVVFFCGAGKIAVSAKTAHVISVRTAVMDCEGLPTTGTLTATITGAQ